MAIRYNAFLVRCWSLPNGERRVEVRHIQSGEQARYPSLAAALLWLDTRATDAPRPLATGAGDRDADADGRGEGRWIPP